MRSHRCRVAALAAVALLGAGVATAATPGPEGASNQLHIALPADLQPVDGWRADPAARGRLRALAREALAGLEPPVGQLPAEPRADYIVWLIDAEGRPVRPDLERVRAAGRASDSTAIRFTFDSPEQPWSPSQLATLQRAVAEYYPVIEAIYGDPAFSITVDVVQDTTVTWASGIYSPGSNEIILPSARLDALCHEMVHAFRDDLALWLENYEEGMTEATEVEVFHVLGVSGYWNRDHRYTYDVYYEALNQPAIGCNQGGFWGSWTLRVMRYQLSGYAWAKVYLEHPDFLREFNRLYFAAAQESDTLRRSEAGLKSLAASLAPTVEGEPFADWAARQYVLDTHPGSGPRIFQFVNAYWAFCFVRAFFGEEHAVDGESVAWSVFDADDVLVAGGDGLGISGGFASLPYDRLRGAEGRLRVEVAGVFAGDPAASVTHRTGAGVAEMCGVLTEGASGSARLTALDAPVPPLVVPIERGVFTAPELTGVRGRIEIEVTYPDGRSFSRIVTKDAAPYLAILETPAEPVPVPAGRAVLRAVPSVTARDTRLLLDRRLDAPGLVTLYDVAGRIVRRLPMVAGAAGVDWDGRDGSGAAARAGVYFARCASAELEARTRVVVLD